MAEAGTMAADKSARPKSVQEHIIHAWSLDKYNAPHLSNVNTDRNAPDDDDTDEVQPGDDRSRRKHRQELRREEKWWKMLPSRWREHSQQGHMLMMRVETIDSSGKRDG